MRACDGVKTFLLWHLQKPLKYQITGKELLLKNEEVAMIYRSDYTKAVINSPLANKNWYLQSSTHSGLNELRGKDIPLISFNEEREYEIKWNCTDANLFGCNRYAGYWGKGENDRITFYRRSTQVSGASHASTMIRLEKVDSFTIIDDKLILKQNEDTWHTFTSHPTSAKAQFAGGSGTEEDPFQIASIEQLQKIGESEYRSRHFIQIADIDASDTKNWNDGKGFKPVSFRGSYDGNGYVISNLYINRKEEDSIGLFRTLSGDHSAGRSGIINRIGLENVDITGRNDVGGLAGSKGIARVTSSYVTGHVTGQNRVGGLFGHGGGGCGDGFPFPNPSPHILSSYAHVEVSGRQMVGGIAGEAMLTSPTGDFYRCGHIHETYASGSVSGDDMVGGWIGLMEDVGTHSANYWSKSHNEGLEAIGYYFWPWAVPDVEGLTTDQMTGQNAWIFMHKLDFENTWQLTEGYPVLRWQEPSDSLAPPQASILTIDPRGEVYEFEEVEAGSQAIREFTLRNKGNIVMTGQVLLEEEGSGAFEIVSGGGPFELSPGSEQKVEVVFSPPEANRYQAVLKIQHDAANLADPVEIGLKGREATYTSAMQYTDVPSELMLHQNYPNPFNPSTRIRYSLPEAAHVTVEVFDITGRQVATLVDRPMSAGEHAADFDAGGLSSGIYVYRISAYGYSLTRRMTLVR